MATFTEVIDMATEEGWYSYAVQKLSNFLGKNSTYFTSSQYDEMLSTIEEVGEEFVVPLAEEYYHLLPGDLTDTERADIYDKLIASGDAITMADKFYALFESMGVQLTLEGSSNFMPEWGAIFYDTYTMSSGDTVICKINNYTVQKCTINDSTVEKMTLNGEPADEQTTMTINFKGRGTDWGNKVTYNVIASETSSVTITCNADGEFQALTVPADTTEIVFYDESGTYIISYSWSEGKYTEIWIELDSETIYTSNPDVG